MKHTGAFLLALAACAPALAACVAVEGDRILAKDLAAARPEFGSVEPTEEIGFAPRPGVTRVLQGPELAALARRFGVVLGEMPARACFVRPAGTAAPPRPALPELAVQRGEKVSVEVTSGAALVKFQAEAESSGRTGDSILMRNPETGSLFQARVESKGKVLVRR